MFEKFTEKAIKVIMLAQEETRLLGYGFIGTEHILLGLVSEQSGRAASVLSWWDLNLVKARQEIEAITGRGVGYQGIEIPFTQQAKRSLDAALEESRRLGCKVVDTRHLLLGLIHPEVGTAVDVLKNLGVNISDLRSQLLQTYDEDILASEDREAAIYRAPVTQSANRVIAPDGSTASWKYEGEGVDVFAELFEQLETLIEKLSGALSEAEYIRRQIQPVIKRIQNASSNSVTEMAFNRGLEELFANLSDSSSPQRHELRECLIELRAAIADSDELEAIDKADVIAQIRLLAEAALLSGSTQQRAAGLAIKVIRGTIALVSLDSQLSETGERCLPIVTQYFE